MSAHVNEHARRRIEYAAREHGPWIDAVACFGRTSVASLDATPSVTEDLLIARGWTLCEERNLERRFERGSLLCTGIVDHGLKSLRWFPPIADAFEAQTWHFAEFIIRECGQVPWWRSS